MPFLDEVLLTLIGGSILTVLALDLFEVGKRIVHLWKETR